MEQDIITMGDGKVTAAGSVAQRLLHANFDVTALRPYAELHVNATLRKDEWKQMDAAVLKAVQSRLQGIADLEARGLVYNIPNGLAKTVLEYEDQSDISAAQISMDGLNRSPGDRPNYEIKYLPMPITHKDYSINARALAASRTGTTPLDTTMAALAALKVAERLEEVLFMGSGSYAFGGGTIYGYVDFPYRHTGSMTANWSTATGNQIVTDVCAMINHSIADSHYGPWMIYCPVGYQSHWQDDFKANSDLTIQQRVLMIEGILGVKFVSKLTGSNVLLVEMQDQTVRLVKGMPVSNVEWQVQGGMSTEYKVMTIQVPQIRADQNNKCGVVHYT